MFGRPPGVWSSVVTIARPFAALRVDSASRTHARGPGWLTLAVRMQQGIPENVG